MAYCPIPNCLQSRHLWEAFCGFHWALVPRPVQHKIARLYRNTRTRSGPTHLRALREAITYIQAKRPRHETAKKRPHELLNDWRDPT